MHRGTPATWEIRDELRGLRRILGGRDEQILVWRQLSSG